MNIPLPKRYITQEAEVLRRMNNNDGTLMETSNPNPMLDSIVYVVQFPYGTIVDYTTHILIEN